MITDISTVIRSAEHILNTAKQIFIRGVFRLYKKEINYIHLPTILDDVISVKSLIDEGFYQVQLQII